MKNSLVFVSVVAAVLCLAACGKEGGDKVAPAPDPAESRAGGLLTLQGVARMLSALPITEDHLGEVYGAVGASSGNGYDEEYTLHNLLEAPGAGVGDDITRSCAPGTRSPGNGAPPIRDLISDYLSHRYPTRAEGGDAVAVEDLVQALSDSDMQIYWPYSEDWDGKTFPIITFDPGFGAETNYGFLLGFDDAGNRKVDSVVVNEAVAREHPVWVVNRNDDSAFTPLELILRAAGAQRLTGPLRSADPQHAAKNRNLMIRTFEMKRNYDSWFGGASEFFIKCGTVKGFSAKTEAELKNYSPSVTDMMIVVRRRDVGKPVPFDAILLSGFTTQLDKLAFLVTEDDGGTRTTWKCQATVKVNSKSYGFDVEIPFHDIVWRGQLPASFFQSEDEVTGRFGDVVITFALD